MNPARTLAELLDRVRWTEGLTVQSPLSIRDTAAGPVISLDDPSTISTPGGDTSPPLPPCTGVANWAWNASTLMWDLASSTCFGVSSCDCSPVPPGFCGGGSCTTAVTDCSRFQTPTALNCGGGTSSTAPPKSCCDSGECIPKYYYACSDVGFPEKLKVTVNGFDPFVLTWNPDTMRHEGEGVNSCGDPAYSAFIYCNSGTLQYSDGPTDLVGSLPFSATIDADCFVPVTIADGTPAAPPCGCRWVWDASNARYLQQSTCPDPACVCSPPADAPLPGAPSPVVTDCTRPVGGTTSTTTTGTGTGTGTGTTTAPPTPPCAGTCMWRWTILSPGRYGWKSIPGFGCTGGETNPCYTVLSPCQCPKPPRDGTPCEVYPTDCVQQSIYVPLYVQGGTTFCWDPDRAVWFPAAFVTCTTNCDCCRPMTAFGTTPCCCPLRTPEPPSKPGTDCTSCVFVPCTFDCTGIVTTTSTTGTGTVPPGVCTGECRWRYTSGQWVLIGSTCSSGCSCNRRPGIAGTECQQTTTACEYGPPTTTTTTTTTTTAAPSACYGNRCYSWNGSFWGTIGGSNCNTYGGFCGSNTCNWCPPTSPGDYFGETRCGDCACVSGTCPPLISSSSTSPPTLPPA